MKRTSRIDALGVPTLIDYHSDTPTPDLEFKKMTGKQYTTLSNFKEYTKQTSFFRSNSKRQVISFIEIANDYDLKMISARQMVALSFDLYTAGYIDQEQHLLLSYQAELQPNFNETIGALINQNSAPDKPRDFIALWIERCLFEQNYPGPDYERAYRLIFILNLLTALEKTAQMAKTWQKKETDADETLITNFPSLSLKRKEY